MPFPKFITNLPQVANPYPGLRGWISQAPDHQVIYFDIEPIGDVPPHSHGEQWGIVVDGEMELTIGGVARLYRKGDGYHIPAGVVHSARFPTHVLVIDIFADKDRYKAK